MEGGKEEYCIFIFILQVSAFPEITRFDIQSYEYSRKNLLSFQFHNRSTVPTSQPGRGEMVKTCMVLACFLTLFAAMLTFYRYVLRCNRMVN